MSAHGILRTDPASMFWFVIDARKARLGSYGYDGRMIVEKAPRLTSGHWVPSDLHDFEDHVHGAIMREAKARGGADRQFLRDLLAVWAAFSAWKDAVPPSARGSVLARPAVPIDDLSEQVWADIQTTPRVEPYALRCGCIYTDNRMGIHLCPEHSERRGQQ